MTGLPQNEATTAAPASKPLAVEIVALAIILVLIAGFGLGYAWLRQSWCQPAGTAAGLTEPQAEAIVVRGSTLTGLDEPAARWIRRLADGRASLADYLLRLFVSPDYLASQPDDARFIADIFLVLTGLPPTEAELAAARDKLETMGSRLLYMNELLASQGYAARLALTSAPTRLRTIAVANDRPAAGAEIVGLLAITSEIRLTGPAARFRLYDNGRLHGSMGVEAADPTLQNQYSIDWDTRLESPGRHKLALLVQTSDGRGAWVELAEYAVPAVTMLQNGEFRSDKLTAGLPAWYQLNAQDGQALLLVTETDQPINLQLIDLRGQLAASATCLAGQPAALRQQAAATDAANKTCYVRVSATNEATGGAISYSLVQALAAARPLDAENRLLAVLKRQDQQILVQDETGEQAWRAASDYSLIDPTSQLASLALTFADGSDTQFAPAFNPGIRKYGLYVETGTSQLTLSALAMEGSAAGLRIERINEAGEQESLDSQDTMNLDLSENHLILEVTGFDGSQAVYEVNILRPPHTANFDQTLDAFPFSYRSPLWLLHVQQPAWVFSAMDTGQEWRDFINAQDEGGTSLVSADTSPVEWIEADSPVYDGTSWKAASRQVIEYFADPRNFLDSVNVFQFESLTFNQKNQTRSGLDRILATSFMAAGNEQGIDYAGLLLDAGRKAGISPYFLASKIIQEMGRNGESPLASGTLPDYEGVYNFYNIGSTPNPAVVNGAQINGARFALFGREADLGEITDEERAWLLPWRNPADALTGGAIWIAEKYIRIGQDTLYLQKFDLIQDDGLYIHQYAQNIQMAWAEGRRSQTAYASMDFLEAPFEFSLPVFRNMPEKPQTLP